MRAKSLLSLFALGAAVTLAYAGRRRRGEPVRRVVTVGPRPGQTPDEIDPTPLARGDAEGERFVEGVAGVDFDLTPDLGVEVADPALFDLAGGAAPSGGPAGSRVEPHPYPAAALDEDIPPGASARADIYGDRAALGDGDLYGVHVAAAADRELPDDDRAFDEGENWLEALEASAAEIGPDDPARPLDMLDESDRGGGRRRGATSDTPVADLGSGGPRGL